MAQRLPAGRVRRRTSLRASACRSDSKRDTAWAVSIPALMTFSATWRRAGGRQRRSGAGRCHAALADDLQQAVGSDCAGGTVRLRLRLGRVRVDRQDAVLRVVGHRTPPRTSRNDPTNQREYVPRGDSTPSGETTRTACGRRRQVLTRVPLHRRAWRNARTKAPTEEPSKPASEELGAGRTTTVTVRC